MDLFGGGGGQMQAAVVPAPIVMPNPDDPSVKAAKRKSDAMMLARRGRASTVQTQGDPDEGTIG